MNDGAKQYSKLPSSYPGFGNCCHGGSSCWWFYGFLGPWEEQSGQGWRPAYIIGYRGSGQQIRQQRWPPAGVVGAERGSRSACQPATQLNSSAGLVLSGLDCVSACVIVRCDVGLQPGECNLRLGLNTLWVVDRFRHVWWTTRKFCGDAVKGFSISQYHVIYLVLLHLKWSKLVYSSVNYL